MVDKPALALGADGTLAIVFMEDGDIVSSTSRNDGLDWSPPARVSPATKQNRSGEGVSLCGDEVTAAWMQSSGGPLFNEVWKAESRDFGKSFAEASAYFALKETVKVPVGVFPRPGDAVGIHRKRCWPCLCAGLVAV